MTDIYTLITEAGTLWNKFNSYKKKLDKKKLEIRKIAKKEKAGELYGDGIKAKCGPYTDTKVKKDVITKNILGIDGDINPELTYQISGERLEFLLNMAGYTITELKKVYPEEIIRTEFTDEKVLQYHTIKFENIG